ncbi:MAG: hypothetical protein CM15mP49_16270 [Actinomycetota bacterium]|nr:MAG: hypothetical protein CM15mP49_16270 [Actinomycetota bacterium]
MLDDVGFGSAATFGGPVEMPAVSEIAETGISYNQFHTTALCSPYQSFLAYRAQSPLGSYGRNRRGSEQFQGMTVLSLLSLQQLRKY